MTPAELLLFAPACFALNLTFGPSNLLSVTTGAERGVPAALAAALGRCLAFVPMIAVSAAGLGVLLAASALAFTVAKALGAAYLVWLGVKILRGARAEAGARPRATAPTWAGRARREFLVAIGNPKAILIFTAFFPQFVSPDAYWQSFAALGAVFIVLELVAVALYAALGWGVGRAARPALMAWLSRASGVAMIAFGGALLLARRPG